MIELNVIAAGPGARFFDTLTGAHGIIPIIILVLAVLLRITWDGLPGWGKAGCGLLILAGLGWILVECGAIVL